MKYLGSSMDSLCFNNTIIDDKAKDDHKKITSMHRVVWFQARNQDFMWGGAE